MPRGIHPVPGPGRWGLNLSEKDFVLHPFWATVADNMIVEDGGTLAGRKGLAKLSVTSSAAAQILRQFYGTGAVSTGFCSTSAKLYTNGNAGTHTDRTGALTPGNGYWQFQAFDDGQVRAAQDGETMIKSTGAGNFTNETASSGTLPDGDHLLNAFGRLWGTDAAEQLVIYSGTGNYRAFATADGGGSIDLSNVWPQRSRNRDYVTGLASMGSTLVVFGRNNVVFYADGSGSELGIDPDQMYVVDIIEGVGCVARDSIVQVGGDLVFVSDRGVESLQRLLVQKDNPLRNVSWQIQEELAPKIDAFIDSISIGDTARQIAAVPYPAQQWYILILDNGASANDVYVFHMGQRTQDEQGREFVPITKWVTNDTGDNTDFLYNATHGTIQAHSGDLWLTDETDIYEYTVTHNEDVANNAPIHTNFETGWMTIPQNEQTINMLKAITWTYRLYETEAMTPTCKWGTDYTATLQSKASASSTDLQRRVNFDTDVDTEGRVFKIGLSFDETSSGQGGGGIKLQSFNMLVASGRLAIDR